MAEQVTMTSPETSPVTSPWEITESAAGLRRSPLGHLDAELLEGSNQGVTLREVPFLTMIGLRVDPSAPAGAALAAAAGTPLPSACGEVSGTPGGTAVLWQGPDEFLLVHPDRAASIGNSTGNSTADPTVDLTAALLVALGDAPGTVLDLSANRTTVELSGPAARDVLQKGCPLDLHPRVFGPGTAVSTLLGPVPVLLWQVDEQTYRILPRASFAEYVARWLLDAMTEFASPRIS